MKVHFMRHVIVWLVIIVVLFPVLWIFTTSIRRDNAYISASLFSSQTTWQNYVDLILEPKNIPALYNEISNIYSLGEPYDKMSEEEVLKKLDEDFKSYEAYFTSTKKMSSIISEDAVWIKENVLPSSLEKAVKKVKLNAPTDLEYVKRINSNLIHEYESLPREVKVAALYSEMKNVTSPSSAQIADMSIYYPKVATAWKTYEKKSKEIAQDLKSAIEKVSSLLSSISGDEAKTLNDAYKQTYEMLESGNFSYGAWFAPIYLRKINMNTIKLTKQLSKSDAEELLELKSNLLVQIKELEDAKNAFLKVYESALNDAKATYSAYVGKDKKTLSELDSSYSQLLSEINAFETKASSISQRLTKDASEIKLFANDIVPTSMALDSFTKIIKEALKNKESKRAGVFYDFSKYVILTEKWVKLAQNVGDFPEVVQRVESMLNDLKYMDSQNHLLAANENTDAVRDVKSSLPFVLIKLNSSLNMSLPVLQDYANSKSEKVKIVEKIQKARQEMKKLSESMIPLREEVEKAESRLSIVSLYNQTKKILQTLSYEYDKIDSFQTAQKFVNSLSNFYAHLKNVGGTYKIPSFSRYDEFFNVLKMKETVALTLSTMNKLDTLVDDYSAYIEKLKKRSESYIKVNKLGFPLIVNELSSISTLYQNEYVSKIGPDLGIISRRSHDLSSIAYFSKAKGKLNEINDKSYYITQEWKSKYVPPFMRWLLNSVIVASTAAVITVLLSAFMAYPFSRFRFVGRKYGLIGLLLVQMFPTMMAMVALYLLLNFIGRFFPPLGLNTLGGLAFLYIGGGIAFNAWLIKGFFDAIPRELEEAAMVDGATRFQTFWRIILPLSAPVLAVTTILGFVGNYGDYILASIVLTGINHYTYAVGLQTFSTGAYSTNWGLMTAAALIGMLPILAIFLSLQRFIVGGLTQGSVKG